MAGSATALRIKYGLERDPSEGQISDWARRTREYIRQGMDRDTAGERAAKALFADYRSHFYASEADTIDSLLRLAEGK